MLGTGGDLDSRRRGVGGRYTESYTVADGGEVSGIAKVTL